MNTEQAATALGKSAWWVRRQCKAGTLRASFYGSAWDIEPEAITTFKDAHSNVPRPTAPRRRPRRAA